MLCTFTLCNVYFILAFDTIVTPTLSTRTRNSSSHTQHSRPNTRASSSYTITERPARVSAYRGKLSLLVLGDSSTKYVKLSGAYNCTRAYIFNSGY